MTNTDETARCQFTTVLGVTKTSGFLHPDQIVQGSQSTARSLGVQSQQLPTERSSVGSRSALGAPTQSSESRTAPPSLHPTGLVGVGSDNEHRNQVLARYG